MRSSAIRCRVGQGRVRPYELCPPSRGIGPGRWRLPRTARCGWPGSMASIESWGRRRSGWSTRARWPAGPSRRRCGWMATAAPGSDSATGCCIAARAGVLETYTKREGLPDNYVRALWRDRDGVLWVGTNGGLARMEARRFVAVNADRNAERDWVRSLLEDSEGNLWVGTTSGLSCYNDGRFTIYSHRRGCRATSRRWFTGRRAAMCGWAFTTAACIASAAERSNGSRSKTGCPATRFTRFANARTAHCWLARARAGRSCSRAACNAWPCRTCWGGTSSGICSRIMRGGSGPRRRAAFSALTEERSYAWRAEERTRPIRWCGSKRRPMARSGPPASARGCGRFATAACGISRSPMDCRPINCVRSAWGAMARCGWHLGDGLVWRRQGRYRAGRATGWAPTRLRALRRIARGTSG